jgi:hypothetical protein
VSSRTRRRGAAPAATTLALVLVSLLLSGCGAGFTALTNIPFAPGNSSATDLGFIHIRAVSLVQDDAGDLTELYTAFVNTGPDDVLTGISVQGAKPVTLPAGPIDVPPNQQINLGPTGTRVFVTGLALRPGQFTTVTFQFRDSGTATLNVLIVTNQTVNA